jgi:hypothetical protein
MRLAYAASVGVIAVGTVQIIGRLLDTVADWIPVQVAVVVVVTVLAGMCSDSFLTRVEHDVRRLRDRFDD